MKQVSPFMLAIDDICEEKGLDKAIILETVEAALAAAYRKDYGKARQIIRTKLNPETGQAEMFRIYDVIEDPEEIKEHEHELTLDEAKEIDAKAEYGKEVIVPLPHHDDFGRIAAQTAKQVIIQRIREAERETIYEEYRDKENLVVSGIVQRIERGAVFIDIGRTVGVLFPEEQIQGERYRIGQRLRVLILEVQKDPRGPTIVLSRAHPKMITKLFELEVPEIASGAVEIKSIAREAGARSKIAVVATEEGVDPIGSCVGQRGIRVQAVINELGGEKLDIIEWNEDAAKFISNALSPAKVLDVEIKKEEKVARVEVPQDQLSLAIGKRGQNVRLAAKLTDWKIDIIGAEAIAEGEEGVVKDDGIEEEGREKAPAETDKVKVETKEPAEKTKKVKKTKKSKKTKEPTSEAEEPASEEK
ncbi:MAG TPA: transcription termination/antitermination protein NusA [Candidatus Portnoybacteria bacterium]|nr:transcription termination/antitermination protein NusA [Candidatus Portnoybacteria bacterium]